MARQFTVDELADRWYDRREVANLAGKFVTAILLRKEAEIADLFWAKRDDDCLSFNDGSYVGIEEVRRYFQGVTAHTALVSQKLRELFPEQLSSLSDEALFGVGQLRGLPITTPVIEIAGDGKTAKGLWHIQGSDNGLTEYGPLSYWTLGFLAVDFIREKGKWKLWHVFHAEDVVAPMGENWLHPQNRTRWPELAQLGGGRPSYTVKREIYTPYSPQRPFTSPPIPPEPYESFADTFSYGVGKEARE